MWALTELGISIYDGYNAYSTVSNPNTNNLERGVAVTGFVAGLIGPVGGYGSAGNKVLQINNLFKSSGSTLNSREKNALSKISNDLKDALKTKNK